MNSLFDVYKVYRKKSGSYMDYVYPPNNILDNIIDRTNGTNDYISKDKKNSLELQHAGTDTNKIYDIQSQIIRTTDQTDFRINVPKLALNVIAYLNSEDYQDGEISKTHLYLETLFHQNQMQFREVFQQVWLKLYSQDAEGLRDFICISAGLDYDWLQDRADALVLGSFLHRDENVNEAGLRAVESWDNPTHSDLLSNSKPFEDPYLEEYRKSVISSLRAKS